MAGAGESEVKVSIKIMVNTKARKVVFAEARKDFVDFIFHILSLPLSTVVKLLDAKGMAGCLEDLYKSVESLETDYFEAGESKDSVLKPRAAVVLPLLSLEEYPKTLRLYKCQHHRAISDCQQAYCPYCHGHGRRPMPVLEYTYISPVTPPTTSYVKGPISYMVMDNLEVKPMSATLIKLQIEDFDKLEEKHVEVGLQEGLAILKASMEAKSVLTTVFLGKKTRGRS